MQCYREQQLFRLGQVCLFVHRCIPPFALSVCQYSACLLLSVFRSVSICFPFIVSSAHMRVMHEIWPSPFLSSVLSPCLLYFLCLLSLVLSSPSLPLAAPLPPPSPLPDSCIPTLPSDRVRLVGVGVCVCVCCVGHVVLIL